MGNQGFQGEVRAPGLVVHRARKGTKLQLKSPSKSNQQVSDNENVHHRQTYGGTPSVTSHPLVVAAVVVFVSLFCDHWLDFREMGCCENTIIVLRARPATPPWILVGTSC